MLFLFPLCLASSIGVSMYTNKGFLDKDGHAAVLASGKDWQEAREKAAEFRKQGLVVEIWHENGIKVPEPEIDVNTAKPQS